MPCSYFDEGSLHPLRNGGAPRTAAPRSSSSVACSSVRTSGVRSGMSLNSTELTATARLEQLEGRPLTQRLCAVAGYNEVVASNSLSERYGSCDITQPLVKQPIRSDRLGAGVTAGICLLSSPKVRKCRPVRHTVRRRRLSRSSS